MDFPIWRIKTTDEKEHYIVASKIAEVIKGLKKIGEKKGYGEWEIHSIEFLGEVAAISQTCLERMKNTPQFAFSD